MIDKLTPGETAVLDLMAIGKSDKEIAIALKIAVNNAKARAKIVRQKLGCRNRVEAALAAYRAGRVK